jgi:nucleotide-binding universal stress UspA family protein
MTLGIVSTEAIDATNRDGAQRQPEEGALLARAVGLDAQARECIRVTTFAGANIEVGGEFDAAAIVVGSRGPMGLMSLLFDGVLRGLIQPADRTALVVHSATVSPTRGPRRTAGSAAVAATLRRHEQDH